MEHKGNRRNLAIARPLLEVLFKAKGRIHAVAKEARRRTGDVINRLANKHLETLIRIKPHVLINVSVSDKLLIINKHLETLIRIV